MENIRKTFREYFDYKIKLPEIISNFGTIDDLNTGWYIKYILVKNDDNTYHLDFTAEHRMTNPRHLRINANGSIEFLEMYQEGFNYNPNIPGDEENKRNEYFEHNRNVTRILESKGLMSTPTNELPNNKQTKDALASPSTLQDSNKIDSIIETFFDKLKKLWS